MRIASGLTSCAVAAALLTASACSHSVVIESEPSGAEIRVNGEALGVAPVTYTESTGWEKVYEIEAKKAGFKNTKKTVKQTEWNMPVTIASAGGFLLCGITGIGVISLAGLLFARQLPDRVVVNLEPGSNAPVDAPPPPGGNYGY